MSLTSALSEVDRGSQIVGSPDSNHQDPRVSSLQRDPGLQIPEEALHSDIRLLLWSKWFSTTHPSLAGQDGNLLP